MLYAKFYDSDKDLITSESELHGWVSRIPCPMLSHIGTGVQYFQYVQYELYGVQYFEKHCILYDILYDLL